MYAANLNTQDLHSFFNDTSFSESLLQDTWALPCWQKLPYRAVEVRLPDGSCFMLNAPDLAIKAARTLRMPGSEPMTHLLQQVVPVLEECPEFLIEIASKLTWSEARSLARGAFWRSPCMLLADQFKRCAQMSLTAKVVH